MAFDFTSNIRVGASNSAPRILLYGVEGVGKSTAGAQAPNPIFLCAEDGLVGRNFETVNSYAPQTWKDALTFVEAIAMDKHDYKTLVIDTLDWLEARLFIHVCQRDRQNDIESYGYGKGYEVALTEFRKIITWLDKVVARGINVIITAHSHIKPFANPAGENFDRYEMKVAKKIGAVVKEWADVILFAEFETFVEKKRGEMKAKGVSTQNRIVHTVRTAAWDAKNRYALPEKLPLDMPTILAEISGKSDNGGECAAIMREIDNLIALLNDDERGKAIDYVTANKSNAAKLSALLNKIRVKTQNQESEAA